MGFVSLASSEAFPVGSLCRSRARIRLQHDRFRDGCTAPNEPSGSSNWFLRDFGYDPELLDQDQVDEKALLNLRGVVRTSHVTLNGRSFQNLEAFAPAAEWEELSCDAAMVNTRATERR